MYICNKCGGFEIQEIAWIDANTQGSFERIPDTLRRCKDCQKTEVSEIPVGDAAQILLHRLRQASEPPPATVALDKPAAPSEPATPPVPRMVGRGPRDWGEDPRVALPPQDKEAYVPDFGPLPDGIVLLTEFGTASSDDFCNVPVRLLRRVSETTFLAAPIIVDGDTEETFEIDIRKFEPMPRPAIPIYTVLQSPDGHRIVVVGANAETYTVMPYQAPGLPLVPKTVPHAELENLARYPLAAP